MSKRKPKADMPTTPVVDAISQLHFEGNIVPHQWYSNIVTRTEKQGTKSDLLAITLLSDICYWYRARVTIDEETGKIIERHRAFSADKLQKSYASYAAQFGQSARQVKFAIDRLCAVGAITTEFRTVKVHSGLPLNNVLFIEPVPEIIAQLSMPGCTLGTPLVQNFVPPPTESCTTSCEISQDITENTAENTSDTFQNTSCFGATPPNCDSAHHDNGEKKAKTEEPSKPKPAPLVDFVLQKMHMSDGNAELTPDELWTMILELYKRWFGERMGAQDRKTLGGKIKLRGHKVVAKAFYSVWSSGKKPDNLDYLWGAIEYKRQDVALAEVKRDFGPTMNRKEVEEFCKAYGISETAHLYVECVKDNKGNPILKDGQTQWRKKRDATYPNRRREVA